VEAVLPTLAEARAEVCVLLHKLLVVEELQLLAQPVVEELEVLLVGDLE
jgi:hypothetical protein